jgi:intracellular sulfur oxidation DsrE/DsrF family protein
MVVIGHEGPGIAAIIEEGEVLAQQAEKRVTVFVCTEDVHTIKTARHDMMDLTGYFDSAFAGHVGLLPGGTRIGYQRVSVGR